MLRVTNLRQKACKRLPSARSFGDHGRRLDAGQRHSLVGVGHKGHKRLDHTMLQRLELARCGDADA